MILKAHRTRDRNTIDSIPAIDPTLDARFRDLTTLAHRADHSGDEAGARGLYLEAAAEAKVLLERAMREGTSAILIAPMAFTVAALNLATLQSRAGAMEEARTTSAGAAERLITIAASAATPVALRLNCVRHLRHILNFLADLERDKNASGEIAAPLAERAASVATEVIRIAEMLRQAGPTRDRWAGQPLSPRPGQAVRSPAAHASKNT